MEKYCMADQPLSSFKNAELDYLAQVLFAPLFTLHAVIHIILMILKRNPNQTMYYKPTLCHQQISSSYTFVLLKTISRAANSSLIFTQQ